MKNEKNGKLSLKKETVARLNMAQMSEVKGGSIIEANTKKCYIAVITNTRPIPPCTISIKEISIKEVIING